MSVKVSFLEIRSPGKLEPVITVPKSAVRHDEGEAYVWTVREGIVRRVSVVCGLTTETGIEMRQGLKDGDSVVPPSIDARTASMLNINPTTAVLLLDELVKLKAKDWIALNAANSHVARCLIAIAKSRDLKVVGIVRRSELIPEIEKLGVDFVGVESPDL